MDTIRRDIQKNGLVLRMSTFLTAVLGGKQCPWQPTDLKSLQDQYRLAGVITVHSGYFQIGARISFHKDWSHKNYIIFNNSTYIRIHP